MFARFSAMLLLSTVLAANAQAEEFRIALLCTGSVTDGGWNQLAKEGVDQAAAKLGATVSVIQKVSQDQAGDEMRSYAAKGYQLIIAHGYEYLNPAAEVALETPGIHLAVSGADVARDGIVTIDFDVSSASYQAGIAAARVSKTGKLGFIGGSKIPSVLACYQGFLAGATSVRADATVAETYTSWDQPQQNKAQAEALLQQGVDVIYHDVDAASSGIFEAIAARNTAGGPGSAWVIGCVADQNQNPICPDHILGSAVIKLGDTFASVAESVQAGRYAPGLIRENLAKGTCVFVPNPKLVNTVLTQAILTEITAAGTRLAAEESAVPTP